MKRLSTQHSHCQPGFTVLAIGLLYFHTILCAQPGLVQTKTVLGQIDIHAINETATVATENGSHVAFSVSEGDNSRIIMDGVPIPDVGRGAKRNLIFSPNGKRLAYILYKDTNGGFLANGRARSPDVGFQQGPRTASFVVDGIVGPEFDEIEPSSVVFSPNSARIVYAGRKGKQWSVMIDGKPSPAYDGIEAIEVDRYDGNNSWIRALDASSTLEFAPIFTADSKHVAYMAKINTPRESNPQNAPGLAYTYRIVTDGVPGPAYNTIFSIHVSIDGLHFGYVGMSNGSNQSFNQIVVDGRPGPEISSSSDETFSPDGKHTAYAIPDDKAFLRQVVLDGVAGPKFDQIIDQSLHFSRHGQHFAYLASTLGGPMGSSTQLVLDGVPRPAAEGTLFPAYSTDGQHSANIIQVGEPSNLMLQLIKDGKPYLAPGAASKATIILSPDGKRLAYVQKQGAGECVAVDGVAGPLFDNINPFKIIFSPDSQHIAYLNQKEKKWQVVVDGVAGPEFDEIKDGSLQFSADSSHFMYIANNARRWQVVVDAKPDPDFDQIQYNTPTFSADGKHVAYIGVKGGKQQVWFDGQLSRQYDDVSSTGSLFSLNLKDIIKISDNVIASPLAVKPSGLVFGSRSGRLAYIARIDNNVQVVINGIPGPAFDGVVAGPIVCSDGRLDYLALEKNGLNENIVRVDVQGFNSPVP